MRGTFLIWGGEFSRSNSSFKAIALTEASDAWTVCAVRQTNMIAVRVVVLVQGLLLAAHSDVNARDLKLDKEMKSIPHHDGWNPVVSHGDFGASQDRAETLPESIDVSGTIYPPQDHKHDDPSHGQLLRGMSEDTEDTLTETLTTNLPPRTGNWCAFVHKRLVSVVVSCGSEKYIIKSQSPCHNGTSGCQLVIYTLSTRPVYRQKHKIISDVLWRCCPGHGGKNCEEIVTDGHVAVPEDPNTDIRLPPGGPQFQDTGLEGQNHSQTLELNDHEESSKEPYGMASSGEIQTEEQSYDVPPSLHTDHEHQNERGDPYVKEDAHRTAPSQPHFENHGLVPIHYLKDVMMSHLQPVLDSFNLTLARLSEEVRGLQRDMSDLQIKQMIAGESKDTGGGMKEELQQHENRPTDTVQQLENLRLQLNIQQDAIEKLKTQQNMSHYSLTNLKRDTDVKIKHNQKMLQTGLHSLNSSLSDVQEKQEQLEEKLQKGWTALDMTPSQVQPHDDSAIWEAITRLDNRVFSNTVNLNVINEDKVHITKDIKNLQNDWKSLDDRLNKTNQTSWERNIEAFLEVDAAKSAVQKYASELVKNISSLHSTLQKMEVDMDYLYVEFYKNISSSSKDYDCITISKTMAQLRQAVSNVSMLANENRLLIDTAAAERFDPLLNDNWGLSVEELRLGLQTVLKTLALEQDKHRTLQQNMTTVLTSLLGSQLDIEALQQQDNIKAGQIRKLFNKFDSLLADVLRLTKVLEILLGEEVFDIMIWPQKKKDAHSFPALMETIGDMQEQISKHSKNLASMMNSDEPSEVEDWTSVSLKTKQEQKSGQKGIEEDICALEKTVEQIKHQVIQLEQRCLPCENCTGSKALDRKLQMEMTTVRKNLEDHLKVFSSIFKSPEGLSKSETKLDLDKLSELIQSQENKHEAKKGKKRAVTRETPRRKRHQSFQTAVHRQLPDSPLMFLASGRHGMNASDTIVFETSSINHRQVYSPETGVFKAPVSGFYLFVLTLDFEPGPSLALLMRGKAVAASLYQSQMKSSGPATRVCILQLHQGEEVLIKLVRGSVNRRKPADNTFTGLLLHMSSDPKN